MITSDTSEEVGQHFNFAVPSDPVLNQESSKYRTDVSTPGIISQSLTIFSTVHKGKDCKLSIDGKKLAYIFGKKYGEEDLGGHEASPTLKERLETLNNDLKHLDDVNTYLKNCEDPNINSIESGKNTLIE